MVPAFSQDTTVNRGHSNEEELSQILKGTVMIRRAKKDVLSDLPPKIRTSIPIKISPHHLAVCSWSINNVFMLPERQ